MECKPDKKNMSGNTMTVHFVCAATQNKKLTVHFTICPVNMEAFTIAEHVNEQMQYILDIVFIFIWKKTHVKQTMFMFIKPFDLPTRGEVKRVSIRKPYFFAYLVCQLGLGITPSYWLINTHSYFDILPSHYSIDVFSSRG